MIRAPHKWPGRAKVLALAAAMRLSTGQELKWLQLEFSADGYTPYHDWIHYTQLSSTKMKRLYRQFRDFYEGNMNG